MNKLCTMCQHGTTEVCQVCGRCRHLCYADHSHLYCSKREDPEKVKRERAKFRGQFYVINGASGWNVFEGDRCVATFYREGEASAYATWRNDATSEDLVEDVIKYAQDVHDAAASILADARKLRGKL